MAGAMHDIDTAMDSKSAGGRIIQNNSLQLNLPTIHDERVLNHFRY